MESNEVNPTEPKDRVTVYVQRGALRGWLKDFRTPYPLGDVTVVPDGHDTELRPTIELTTDLMESSVYVMRPQLKYLLNWLYHNGYVIRVCGHVSREAWITKESGQVL